MDNLGLIDKLPTDKGMKSIPEILDKLAYSSYSANRDYGMTHEQLTSIGIGNDKFKEKYEIITPK